MIDIIGSVVSGGKLLWKYKKIVLPAILIIGLSFYVAILNIKIGALNNEVGKLNNKISIIDKDLSKRTDERDAARKEVTDMSMAMQKILDQQNLYVTQINELDKKIETRAIEYRKKLQKLQETPTAETYDDIERMIGETLRKPQ